MKLLVCLLLCAVLVRSFDLNCHTIWSGPSANNDLIRCVSDQLTTFNFLVYGLPALFGVVVLVLLVVFFPITWCVRHCCKGCGSHTMRPGAGCCSGEEWDDHQDQAIRLYPRGRVNCFKASCVVLFLTTLASGGVLVYGGVTVSRGVLAVTQSIQTDVLQYFSGLITSTRAAATVNGTLVPPLNESLFDSASDALEQIDRFVTDVIIANVEPNVRWADVVVYCAACLPAATCLVLLIFCAASVRRCGPSLCSCWAFLWGVVFSVASVAALILVSMFTILCGEVELGLQYRPGIVQWYVVPQCTARVSFGDLSATIRMAEQAGAEAACTSMTTFCDPDPQFQPSNGNAFQCNVTAATVGDVCNSFRRASRVIDAAVVKNFTLQPCDGCTLRECATVCTTDSVRSAAATAVNELDLANSSLRAASELLPILSCDGLVQRALRPFRNCVEIRNGASFAAAGILWAAISFTLMTVCFLKGQKWFISEAERK